MTAPLCVELYCGTFGWAAGWLALGGVAVGFDLEHEAWHGPIPDRAELVIQDVRTLRGSQKNVALHGTAAERRAVGSPGGWWTAQKSSGGSWFGDGNGATLTRNDPRDEARKTHGDDFVSGAPGTISRLAGGSNARRAASALIARIPDRLSQHIAECYYPAPPASGRVAGPRQAGQAAGGEG